MNIMDEDNLLAALTTAGPEFDQHWASFMFNMDQAKKLREKDKEDILKVLAAGARYTGAGWSTGRASKALYDLSGVGIVKGQIEKAKKSL